QTGGKFEIKEGTTKIAESDSESDSEEVVPPPPGETSRSRLDSELMDIIDKKLEALRKDFTESILQDIISKKQSESQSKDQQENIQKGVITDTTHQTMEPPDPQATNEPPISSQAQISEEIENEKLDVSVKDTQIEEIQATMEEELVAKPSDTTDIPTAQ